MSVKVKWLVDFKSAMKLMGNSKATLEGAASGRVDLQVNRERISNRNCIESIAHGPAGPMRYLLIIKKIYPNALSHEFLPRNSKQ